VLCCAVLCCAVLCCAVLCCTALWWSDGANDPSCSHSFAIRGVVLQPVLCLLLPRCRLQLRERLQVALDECLDPKSQLAVRFFATNVTALLTASVPGAEWRVVPWDSCTAFQLSPIAGTNVILVRVVHYAPVTWDCPVLDPQFGAISRSGVAGANVTLSASVTRTSSATPAPSTAVSSGAVSAQCAERVTSASVCPASEMQVVALLPSASPTATPQLPQCFNYNVRTGSRSCTPRFTVACSCSHCVPPALAAVAT
jgi:hypothetical protein